MLCHAMPCHAMPWHPLVACCDCLYIEMQTLRCISMVCRTCHTIPYHHMTYCTILHCIVLWMAIGTWYTYVNATVGLVLEPTTLSTVTEFSDAVEEILVIPLYTRSGLSDRTNTGLGLEVAIDDTLAQTPFTGRAAHVCVCVWSTVLCCAVLCCTIVCGDSLHCMHWHSIPCHSMLVLCICICICICNCP